MRYLWILTLLFMGCDFAPTEHTHENDSLPTDGYVFIWGEYYNIETTTYLNLDGPGVPTPFPTQVFELTNLTRLYLDGNQLTGEIPPEIGNLTNLGGLWLHDNQLTGEIPPEVCELIESNNWPPWWNIEGYILNGNNLINTCE